MSDVSWGEDMKTPLARRPSQDVPYFTEHPGASKEFGITSIRTDIADGVDRTNEHMDSLDMIMAQQELVTRALSPAQSGNSWASPASSQSGRQKPALDLPGDVRMREVHEESESISSRPDTPLSLPSMLPVPSNPSTFPDDQQNMPTGPSLVMPEIRIAQRRPYTESGKRVGKLRIMFCGDSSSGKTTLLRTFAEHSCDIVYLEDTSGSEPGRPTTEINEIQASSQPYPSWRILTSSKSDLLDAVMERNICLVDTPGFGLSAESDDAVDPILQYLETQFHKTNQILRDGTSLNDDDFLSLIAAPQGGFTQVDAVVYCISKELSEIDVSFMQKLSSFASIIPVITKIDLKTLEERDVLRERLTHQLNEMNFEYFKLAPAHPAQPFLVSCSDPEMECSIMMHDEYTPTLVPSDLSQLFSSLLHHEHPPRLRHATAEKFLAWKSKYQQSLIHMPDSELTLQPSADFTRSRIAEHTRQEDRKTRLRIAAWASEMRNSFALARGERGVVDYTANEKSAEWLITRMNDYVEEEKRVKMLHYNGQKRLPFIDEADPFGLLRLRERWTRRLRRIVKWCVELGIAAGVSLCCWQLWQRFSLV